MELIVYGGSGAMDEANNAIKSKALANNYYEKLGSRRN